MPDGWKVVALGDCEDVIFVSFLIGIGGFLFWFVNFLPIFG